MEAVEALDYRPDHIARSLRNARSLTIGLLVYDITNPFCAEMSRAAQQVLASAGYMTILCDGERDPSREQEYLEILSQSRVDGLIVSSSAPDATAFERFSQRFGLPVVLVDSLRSRALDSVRVDNYAGTLHAIAHLASRGYRRIAIIAGKQTILSGAERLDAYRRAVEMYGLEQHDGYVQISGFSEASAYDLTMEILRLDPRPQAIFCSNNTIGFGAFRALKSSGVRIPQEVAILLFDDVKLADLCDPPLTVVAQPVADIGRTAAQLLLRRLQGEVGEAREVLLPPQLILRGSV